MQSPGLSPFGACCGPHWDEAGTNCHTSQRVYESVCVHVCVYVNGYGDMAKHACCVAVCRVVALSSLCLLSRDLQRDIAQKAPPLAAATATARTWLWRLGSLPPEKYHRHAAVAVAVAAVALVLATRAKDTDLYVFHFCFISAAYHFISSFWQRAWH